MTRSTTPHAGTSRWRCTQAIAKSDIRDALAECQGKADDVKEFSKDDWYLNREHVLAAGERVAQAEAMIRHPSVSLRPFAPQEIQEVLQSA